MGTRLHQSVPCQSIHKAHPSSIPNSIHEGASVLSDVPVEVPSEILSDDTSISIRELMIRPQACGLCGKQVTAFQLASQVHSDKIVC